MQIIKYMVKGIKCLIPCPNNVRIEGNPNRIRKVGSAACDCCKYQFINDYLTDTVECSFPNTEEELV